MFRGRPSGPEEAAHAGGQGIEVTQVFDDGVVGPPVVDVQVEMDQQVPEADPALQAGWKVRSSAT